MSILCRAAVAACLCAGVLVAPAAANTSHEGWPKINGCERISHKTLGY